MKKARLTQNNFMKRDFLPFFIFLVLFFCAVGIILSSPKIQAAFRHLPSEPVKTAPAFFKDFKDLLPDFND